MSAETGKKPLEQQNQIQTLEKENKKLLLTCQEPMKSQVIKDAIKGYEDIVEDDKKTIEKHARFWRPVRYDTEKYAY